MERKIPSMLDIAKVVIEKEGEKIEEFVDKYGKICF